MGRIRTIKPEFPQSESMGRVCRDARLFFLLLFTVVDDKGRSRGSDAILASLLYPYDGIEVRKSIPKWVAELEREGCVSRYTVGGQTYIAILNWTSHQRIDHPSKSRIPEPSPEAREASRAFPLGSGEECKGEEGTEDRGPARAGAESQSQAFERLWSACQKKVSKGQAEKSFAKLWKDGALPATDELIARLVALQATPRWQEEGRRFQPHLSTWLNAKGWLDEVIAVTPKPARSTLGSDPVRAAAIASLGDRNLIDMENL